MAVHRRRADWLETHQVPLHWKEVGREELPGGEWVRFEDGRPVVDPQTAHTIARHYGQSAFFWFDGHAFWIIGAAVTAEPVRLPIREAAHRSVP